MTRVEARQLLQRIRALAAAELAGREAIVEPFFQEAARLLDGPETPNSREALVALLDDLEAVLEVLSCIGMGDPGR